MLADMTIGASDDVTWFNGGNCMGWLAHRSCFILIFFVCSSGHHHAIFFLLLLSAYLVIFHFSDQMG
jgi:hypothetical protein